MLYLVTPPFTLLWNTMPEKTLAIAEEHGGDLGRLPWSATEEPHTRHHILSLALRYGHACSRGIAFAAWRVSTVERPGKLAQLTADMVESNKASIAASAHFMEAIAPGWEAYSREQDNELLAAMKDSIANAQRDADEILSSPELPHLVSAWERIGGARF